MGELSGHVVVCGLSNLGFRVVEQLHSAGVAVAMVDERADPSLSRRLGRWGVPVLTDAAHTAEALHQARLSEALALVTCHDSDLDNLEVALLAADVAPDVRLVARFANAQLSDQLATALPAARVLSLSGKAGPGFVEACIRSDVLHAFRLGDDVFAVVDVPVMLSGTVRDSFGRLTPVWLRRAEQRVPEACPPRDTPVSAGDQVALLARRSDLAHVGIGAVDADILADLAAGEGESVSGRQGLREWTRALSMTVATEFDRPFRIALAVVLAIMLASTLILSASYVDQNPSAPADFDSLDALYLTVETMATVGYGDYNFGAAKPWMQVFGIVLMLAGALSIAVVYAFITNIIISRRIERTLGRRRANAVRGHVIICGLGSVGLATMEGLLAAGRDVVVIERDENNRFLPTARDLHVPVIIGDATVSATLLEAGLGRAATLAALTSDDVANLETVLSAREAFDDMRRSRRRGALHRDGGDGPAPRPAGAAELRVVLRVFDTGLADEVERRFDIHTARSASALATPWFVGAALGFEVVSTFYVERTPFLVVRVTVAEGGGLDGPSLLELSAGVRVVLVYPAPGHGATPPQGTAATRQGGRESGRTPPPEQRCRPVEPAQRAEPDAGAERAGGPYQPDRHTRLRAGDSVLIAGPTASIVETVRRNQQVGAGQPAGR